MLPDKRKFTPGLVLLPANLPTVLPVTILRWPKMSVPRSKSNSTEAKPMMAAQPRPYHIDVCEAG